MAENLTRQLLAKHLADGELRPGEEISLRVDQTLTQDATGTMAFMQFERLGVPRVRVERAVQYVDHNVIQLDYKNPDDHRMLQALCAKYGAHFSRVGDGICDYIHVERFAKPGDVLVGSDNAHHALSIDAGAPEGDDEDRPPIVESLGDDEPGYEAIEYGLSSGPSTAAPRRAPRGSRRAGPCRPAGP